MAVIRHLRRSSRRDSIVALTTSSIVAILIAGFVALEMAHAYRNEISGGRIRSANLALLLEEQTRRTIQVIDFILRDVANVLERAQDTPKHDPILTSIMRSRLKELPYVRSLFVVGADGHLVQDTDSDTPDISLADRDYFQAHVNAASLELYVGRPLKSRSVGQPWFLSISRAIHLSDGKFYGVAVAAVEPKFFADMYSNIQMGKEGALALIHSSGTVIARYPEYEGGMGLSLGDTLLFSQYVPSAPNGFYEETSEIDGSDRVFQLP